MISLILPWKFWFFGFEIREKNKQIWSEINLIKFHYPHSQTHYFYVIEFWKRRKCVFSQLVYNYIKFFDYCHTKRRIFSSIFTSDENLVFIFLSHFPLNTGNIPSIFLAVIKCLFYFILTIKVLQLRHSAWSALRSGKGNRRPLFLWVIGERRLLKRV